MSKDFKFDGRSFAPQLRGEKGKPREWVFVQLGRNWYVRNDGWKLNQSGELFDMSDSPFVENLVPSNDKSSEAKTARKKLQAALDELNPAGGKLPPPGGNKEKAKKRKRRAAQKDA
jgi:arylsulfatase A